MDKLIMKEKDGTRFYVNESTSLVEGTAMKAGLIGVAAFKMVNPDKKRTYLLVKDGQLLAMVEQPSDLLPKIETLVLIERFKGGK